MIHDLEQIIIIIDDRELKTSIAKVLFKLGAKLDSKRLETGDFILSDRVIVERKSVKDFVDSILDSRLFKQAAGLKKEFQIPVFIIEGKEDIYSQRNVNANAIRGAIASIITDFSIPIINSQDENDTANIIYSLAKREQVDFKRSINIRGKKKPLTTKELQEFIVSGLPGVGLESSKKLLKHFKTIRNVFNSTAGELMEVENFGKAKAEEIKKVIDAEYHE